MLDRDALLSLAGFLIFVQELALLGFLILRGVRDTESEGFAAHGPPTSPTITPLPGMEALERAGHLDEDVRFLFDVVARQNERIVQNIDALDNALVAVAVGIIAIALFAADKWLDLDLHLRFAGFFFLVQSAVCTVFGYGMLQLVGVDDEDGVRLSDFAADFSVSPERSTSSAIWSITRSAKTNIVVRRFKRASVILASFLAVVAAGLIIVGRAVGIAPSS